MIKMSDCNKTLTVSLYSRADVVSNLPEVGDTLVRSAKEIDRKIEVLNKLVTEIHMAERDLVSDICENWNYKEINDSLGKRFSELATVKRKIPK